MSESEPYLEAETGPVSNGWNVTDAKSALPAHTGGHVDLLLQSKLGDLGLSLGIRSLPRLRKVRDDSSETGRLLRGRGVRGICLNDNTRDRRVRRHRERCEWHRRDGDGDDA